MPSCTGTAQLRDFVTEMSLAIERYADAADALRNAGENLLMKLVSRDDWLPKQFAESDSNQYRQFLLHCDSRQRFSVVSFVWGAGQCTPIHDHRTWGIVGVLRGAEISQAYARDDRKQLIPLGPPLRLAPGEVAYVSPEAGDIHRVCNAYDDRPSISIHVYGANIGAVKRASYDADGHAIEFVSGYSNIMLPNIWDLSKGQQ